MKKSKFLVAACALPLLLASCGVDKGIVIWSPFGSTYSGAIKDLIDAVQEETGYHMTHESQGNYKAIYTNIKTLFLTDHIHILVQVIQITLRTTQ